MDAKERSGKAALVQQNQLDSASSRITEIDDVLNGLDTLQSNNSDGLDDLSAVAFGNRRHDLDAPADAGAGLAIAQRLVELGAPTNVGEQDSELDFFDHLPV